jgi:uncharacterized membrane protein
MPSPKPLTLPPIGILQFKMKNFHPFTFTQQNWLRLILVILIGMGVFFRCVNLDHKVFWDDEALTGLRISGYTTVEVTHDLYATQDLSFADLKQYLEPNSNKTIQDMLQGLATEDPHLPLFYFFIARFWAQCLGGSIGMLRALSVLFGLLSLPAMFWLCLELFRSRSAAWMGVVVLSVSPFHVLYSQEARSYSLWILITLLSSAVLLRSLRQSTLLNWSLYGILVSLGIYSHLFHGFIVIGHGIYILLLEGFQLRKRFLPYLIATTLGGMTFVPWMMNLVTHRGQAETMVDSILHKRYSLASLMSMWIGNISRLFLDVGLGSHDPWQQIIPVVPLIVGLMGLIGYALYFLCKKAEPRVSLFVLTLTFTPSVFYLVFDVLVGGRVSGLPRYAIGMLLGVQLAIIYTFTLHVKRLWTMVIAVVLSCSVFSCAVSLPEMVWWHKGPQNTRYIPEVTALLNQFPHPYIITDQGFARIPAIAYPLKSEARFQLVPPGGMPRLPQGNLDIFVFRPSPSLQQQFKRLDRELSEPLLGTGKTLYKLKSSKYGKMIR